MTGWGARRGWLIAASFGLALVLSAVPLPEWANAWRPAWVPMVLIYWCLALPERVGVGVGWVVGLVLDVLRGTLLGQHALGLAILAYVSVKLHQRVRMFPLWQQAVLVGVMLVGYVTLTTWVRVLAGLDPQRGVHWHSALSSALLWPWLFVILRDVRRRGQVA